MKYAILSMLALCAEVAGAAQPIGPQLQEVSVNIACRGSYGSGTQGSGTIICTTIDQKPAIFVLTADHVVRGLRQVREVIGAEGEKKSAVTYLDAQLIQEQVENGRVVGERKYDCRIISVDAKRDIALLRCRKGDFTKVGAKFYLGDAIPQPGTLVYHCGAPGGVEIGGSASLTSGIVSRLGVRIPEYGGAEHGIFDQTDASSMGGSSGGMVALQSTGEWIGMITLGLQNGDSFNWIVPVRSVRSWTKQLKIEWLLDPKQSRPTEADVSAIPIEIDSQVKNSAKEKSSADSTAIIHPVTDSSSDNDRQYF